MCPSNSQQPLGKGQFTKPTSVFELFTYYNGHFILIHSPYWCSDLLVQICSCILSCKAVHMLTCWNLPDKVGKAAFLIHDKSFTQHCMQAFCKLLLCNRSFPAVNAKVCSQRKVSDTSASDLQLKVLHFVNQVQLLSCWRSRWNDVVRVDNNHLSFECSAQRILCIPSIMYFYLHNRVSNIRKTQVVNFIENKTLAYNWDL
jgi:hypothetical protein